MKVLINIIEDADEEEVCFSIHSMNNKVNQAIHLLTSTRWGSLLCRKDEVVFKINVEDILYLEAVDRKVFAYTQTDTFEVSERLYVLENQLFSANFIRVSKSMLLNIEKIYAFYPMFSGNLEALLVNQEKVKISRRYVPELKKKLGMEEDA